MLQFSTRKITGTLTLVALLCVSQAHISGSNRPPLPTNHDAEGRKPPAAAAAEHARTRFLQTPLRFERVTRGDGQKTADFVARGLGYAVYLSGGHATVMLGSSSESWAERISMRLVGSHESSLATGKREFPGRTNQYLGNDRRRWQRGIPSYAEVEYADVYPGVDLVYYGNQRQLEYDFVVGPGADPGAIALRVTGADTLEVDARGGNPDVSATCRLKVY